MLGELCVHATGITMEKVFGERKEKRLAEAVHVENIGFETEVTQNMSEK